MTTNDASRRPLWGLGRRRAQRAAEQPAEQPVEQPTGVVVGAPVPGTAVPLTEVEDPAFAAELLGPGMAVRPTSGTVVAPVAGTVVSAMPHAYGLRSTEGIEVLVHIGIDTVTLRGQHFDQLVQAGQQVAAGDPLAEVDLAAVAAAGLPTTVVVVITNAPASGGVEPHDAGTVGAGRPLLLVRTVPA